MQWFKNLNATPRLMISFGLMVLLIAGLCSLAIFSLAGANDRMEVLYQKDMVGVMHADSITVARMELGRSGRDAIINMQDPEVVAADEKIMLADFDTIHSNLDGAEGLFYTEAGQAALKSIRTALPAYEQAYHDLFARVRSKDAEGARAALQTVNTVGAPLYAGADAARRAKQSLAPQKFEQNESAYHSTRAIMVCATLLAILAAIVLSIVLARTFSGPLALAVQTLEQVAQGDLTVSLDVHTRDEMGRMAVSVNQAIEKLRETLQDVAGNATAAAASSQELAAAADAIATGAQQQAASLEQTSASLEQITATVRQSADNAKQANQVASGSKDSAERGQQVVSDAVTAMGEINTASAKISDIISTIDEIAFQTNLLAVNAAVEAARAGEEGRGFAVVATEVRSLAQRSAGAAKEIKTLIQDSLRKVEKGTELVNRSGETLRTIVGSVKAVTDIVSEIAAAAAEQSTGVEQVNTAMTQMDHVTQSNAAQTEQLSSTAQALSEQAIRLKELVGTFVLGSEGTSPRSTFAPSRSAAVLRPQAAVRPRTVMRPATAARSKANGVAVHQSLHSSTTLIADKPGSEDDASFEEF